MKFQAIICQISKFTPALVLLTIKRCDFCLTKEKFFTHSILPTERWFNYFPLSKPNTFIVQLCQWDKHWGYFLNLWHPMCLLTDAAEWCLPRKHFFSTLVIYICSKNLSVISGSLCVIFSFLVFIICEIIIIQDCPLIVMNARKTMWLITVWILFYSKCLWHYLWDIYFLWIPSPHCRL